MTPALAEAIAGGPVVLDGGLATHLETMGHDLSGTALWSARLIADEPEAIVAAHADFFAAGAQVATTATYQASYSGFASIGLDVTAAERITRRGVQLAIRARDEASGDGVSRWVAASIGPYGAMLADGSEYRGDYDATVAELRRWHRPRLQLLADTGADVLAAETIPCAAEVEALVAELAGSGVPAWISISARMHDGAAWTAAGEPLAEVAAMMRGVDEIIAVGVNCCDPRPAADMVHAATQAAGKPGVAYPNSGETWDAAARAWTGSGSFTPALVAGWRDAGAVLIGGCCRVDPEAIAAIRAGLRTP
jgi:homocysteine S-methyltransferase